MKALLVGLGQIGLGLIVPVFQKAGYQIIGTDANAIRLNELRHDYFIESPGHTLGVKVGVVAMDEVANDFDLIITSVGKRHLEEVAKWYHRKNLSSPVLMAENLPDPVGLFPWQIPIVVDRICPRVEGSGNWLSVVAEGYFKIVILDDPLTHQLGSVDGVELESSEVNVELKRQQKMFTVNTAHVVTALYGEKFGCEVVEQAIANEEVVSKVRSALSETCTWLGLGPEETEQRTVEIVRRFASPLHDSISRILGPFNRASAMRYLEVPLDGVYSLGGQAPTLKEAQTLLTAGIS